jgi:hypothetical protein
LVFALGKDLGRVLYLHQTYVPLLTDPYSGKAYCFGLYCTLYWGKESCRVKLDGLAFTGHKNCHGVFKKFL